MLMWGDIIMQHPDKLDLIPKDVVMMCWEYGPRQDYNKCVGIIIFELLKRTKVNPHCSFFGWPENIFADNQ